MKHLLDHGVPEVVGLHWNSRGLPAPRPAHLRRFRPPRPGQRSILLSAANRNGGGIVLAFTRTRGGIAFWRSLSAESSPLQRIATFPGPFTVPAVARLLLSGAARPAVDVDLVAEATVDGVPPEEAEILKLAWCRDGARVDPRAEALLGFPLPQIAAACERTGADDVETLLELGGRALDANQAWLAKHEAVIDAEVDRRSLAAGASERGRREIRGFVERCLLTLGRLPRPDETPEHWDGSGLEGRDLGVRTRRRLGLYQTGRAGRFRVWVQFWNGLESVDRGEFGSGIGWYWDVTNPDPMWIIDGIMGPCRTPDDAWSDASCLEGQE